MKYNPILSHPNAKGVCKALVWYKGDWAVWGEGTQTECEKMLADRMLSIRVKESKHLPVWQSEFTLTPA